MKEPNAGEQGSPTGASESRTYLRLVAARGLLERGFDPPPGEKQRILRERARALAREPQPTETSADTIETVEFLLANERYAVTSDYVREIWPLKELTPLPCVPQFVCGIVSIRGEILSVVDLKRFFELPDKGLGELNKVIVLHDPAMVVGILADDVLGVSLAPKNEIHAPPPTLTGIRAAYTLGITRERTVVLDAAKMLTDERLVVHEEVET